VNLEELGAFHKCLGSYKYRLDQARRFVREALERATRPYLSISGGKDSVAMLAVVDGVAREMGVDFPLWTHVSDASFPGTLETIQKCAEITGRELIVDRSPVSAFDVDRDQDAYRPFGKQGYFFDAIRRFQQDYKPDLAFVGVRAEESKRRTRACHAHGHLFSTTVTGRILVCYPLAWWSVEDVCACIVDHGLPFHPVYSMRSTDGDARSIRLGYITARDLAHKGTIVFIKINYPHIYNYLVSKFPELRAYV
jgi:3'-phosphoadenosine 5'-phosphosulfate sulfotransferase (PAPS reductase)/FAD synthetase